MIRTRTTPTPEELDILAQVIRHVARAGRLSPHDAEDFEQSVHLRLLERDYNAFERFGGRSSLRTYLTVVVRRMLLDWRNTRHGKWRASSAATRLGPDAVALERLIFRDGWAAQQAVEILSLRSQTPTAALADLVSHLPQRRVRRQVSDDTLADIACANFDDPIDAADRRRARRRVRATLAAALLQLPADDRWLIQARYRDSQSIQSVAKTLQVDPKRLYRRVDKAIRSLRRALNSAGISDSHLH
jgi:RNA polymerase sigma-70 factor, ECF subfamily